MNMFRKYAPVALVALLLVTAACQPKATATVSPTPVPATATPMPVATTVPAADPSEPVTVVAPETPGTCIAAPLAGLPVRVEDGTDYGKGASAESAKLTIYEYSDFQCPGCAGMYPVLQAYLDDNPDTRLVYRHFPLDFHPYAMVTAEAVEAAGAQGKFWEMHNLLFDKASEWASLDEAGVRAKMTQYAETLKLDVERFDRELDDDTYVTKIQSQYEESLALGLPGTPSFIFGEVLFPSQIGLSYSGLEAFRTVIDQQDTLFYEAPPEQTIDIAGTYEATFRTSKGDIVVNLLPVSAPANVNSFVFLANEGWYDGSEFFFVQDNFVAVSGDPTNSTVGYPGYYCQGEEQGVFDRAGLVGMLASGQFFIALGSDASQLDGQFALIGQVTQGLDVLEQLARRQLGDPSAPTADVLETVIITQK